MSGQPITLRLTTTVLVALMATSLCCVAQEAPAPAGAPQVPGQYGASTGTSIDGIPLLWVRQKSPVGSHLFSVFFLNADVGWVCGRRGVILTTTNGGEEWVRRDSTVDVDLNKILFLDAQNGWCVGDEGTILRSTDGGVTWAKLNVWSPCNLGEVPDLYDILFLGDDGYIVGQFYTVLHTRDGGRTWIPRQGPLRLSREKTDNVTIIEVAEFREPYREYNFMGVDGNNSYSNPNIRQRYIQKIQTRTDQNRWVHRHRLRRASPNEIYYAASFVSPEIGWIVGRTKGRIMHSATGWFRWAAQHKRHDHNATLYDVQFIDQETGWAVGTDGIWLTRDGGVRWYRPRPPHDAYTQVKAFSTEWDRQDLASPYRWDRTPIWVYQGHPEVRRAVCYYDGVGHRELVPHLKDSSPPTLRGVQFLDHNIGFAVGDRAHIIFTVNGGFDWALYVAPHLNQGPDFQNSTATWHTPDFYDVNFVDNSVGWVVGQWGTILKYNGPPLEASPREPEESFPFQQVLRRQAYYFDSKP